MSKFKRFMLDEKMPIYMEHLMQYFSRNHQDVHPTERYLLMELVRRQEYGFTYTSFQKLGKAMGCNANTAENAAKRLRGRGWISWKSGSKKGDERRANEYSIEPFLELLRRSYADWKATHPQAGNLPKKLVGGINVHHPENWEGSIVPPKTCEGHHPNNFIGGLVDHPKSCGGPSQDLVTNNCIQRNIYMKASKQLMPKSFEGRGDLSRWVATRPALKSVTYECLRDFFDKMSEANWVDRKSGKPIANMEKYILSWQENFVPEPTDGYVDPGESLRRDAELARLLAEKYGRTKS